jgi:hypothetical protein
VGLPLLSLIPPILALAGDRLGIGFMFRALHHYWSTLGTAFCFKVDTSILQPLLKSPQRNASTLGSFFN